MKQISHLFLVMTLIFALSGMVQAGTWGKITGTVVDAENGQPIPGVNVIVQGMALGAVSNLEGQYTILNVPAGTYELKFSIIGYAEYRVQQVKVTIDITTVVNAKLRSQALEGEEVVVVAQRPVVTRDISNSQMNIEAKTIESMPVQTIKEVLTLQAGIERGSEGIIVRGGGAHQTVFMLDGLSLNDERSNIPYVAVSLSSVREVQVQTGGFNAEYGNLRSGLVNVVTREGDVRRYNLTASLQYRPPAPKHFGPSIYDPMSYFNRPYMDPDVCYTGTANGAWDDYTRRQYPSFQGWNGVSEKLVQDANPNNDLTPEAAKRVYEWQHRRQGDIKKPDFVVDAGFGGPVPLFGKQLGNLRFFASYFQEQEMFIFPLSTDHYGENHTQLKLTSDLSASMKLTFTGLYGEISSVSPYDWTTTPTGRVLRDQSEIAGLIRGASRASAILYQPGYYSPSEIYRNIFGVQFTHMLSSKTFYEVSLQNNINRYKTYQMATRDTSRIYEPTPGYFVDEAPWGYWGYGVNGIDGMSMGGWMNLGRDRSVNSTTSFKLDVTSQINNRNQLKTGINIVYNDYRINSGTYSPSMSTWTREMKYRVFPYRIGVYAQDKLEFEGFIANLGVRLDYSNPNGTYFAIATYDKSYGAGYGNAIETTAERKTAKDRFYISPRLGVSHPITANSKLYFNYGHFRSEPFSSYRFRLQRESSGLVTYIGDPNLEMELTIAYELGYSQNLFNMMLLNLAAYYKDVSNQPGWIYYENIQGNVKYNKAANNNYADIRGFEVTLSKNVGEWITGFVNYTYDVQTSGYFGLQRYYQDPNKQRDYLRNNPYQSRPHPRPYARFNVDVHTPRRFGPQISGFYPIAEWSVNVLANWRSGAYETYNPNAIPGIVDNVRWKDWYNVDMRISRMLRVSTLQLQFYLDISNVFNIKYLSSAGFSDTYDYNYYLESLCFDWETGDQRGHDKIGDLRPDHVKYDPLEPNPNNDPEIAARNKERKKKKSYIDNPNIEAFRFLNPRDFRFGLKLNF